MSMLPPISYIRDRRLAIGMTQERLARRAHMCIRTVRDLEHGRGNASIPSRKRLLAVLRVAPFWPTHLEVFGPMPDYRRRPVRT